MVDRINPVGKLNSDKRESSHSFLSLFNLLMLKKTSSLISPIFVSIFGLLFLGLLIVYITKGANSADQIWCLSNNRCLSCIHNLVFIQKQRIRNLGFLFLLIGMSVKPNKNLWDYYGFMQLGRYQAVLIFYSTTLLFKLVGGIGRPIDSFIN